MDLKKFRVCLEENQVVLSELSNPARLRQQLWVQYLIRSKSTYLDLLSAFNDGKDKIAEIVSEAKAERTKWGEVISIFNERFSVPFVVRMDNQEDVILKSDAPSICFDFLENPDDRTSTTAPIEEADLKRVLSNGESRALYILNIIFEVEARRNAGQSAISKTTESRSTFSTAICRMKSGRQTRSLSRRRWIARLRQSLRNQTARLEGQQIGSPDSSRDKES